MAGIKATCERCGDVELRISEVTVRRCIETDDGSYRFSCPTCAITTIKSIARRTVDLLIAAGVDEEAWSLPSSLGDLHVGNVIDHDDLLAFHDAMKDESVLASAMDALVAEFPTLGTKPSD